MDTTKFYVKMCRYARILQDGWRPQSGDWWHVGARDLFSPILRVEYDGQVKWRDSENEYLIPRDIQLYGIVWLPRQDQLMRFIYPQRKKEYEPMTANYFKLERVLSFSRYIDFEYDLSMEKLWLMFFMAWKCKKIWKDGRWMKDQKVLEYV